MRKYGNMKHVFQSYLYLSSLKYAYKTQTECMEEKLYNINGKETFAWLEIP